VTPGTIYKKREGSAMPEEFQQNAGVNVSRHRIAWRRKEKDVCCADVGWVWAWLVVSQL